MDFKAKNAPKSTAAPDPAGRAYSAPSDLLGGLCPRRRRVEGTGGRGRFVKRNNGNAGEPSGN